MNHPSDNWTDSIEAIREQAFWALRNPPISKAKLSMFKELERMMEKKAREGWKGVLADRLMFNDRINRRIAEQRDRIIKATAV